MRTTERTHDGGWSTSLLWLLALLLVIAAGYLGFRALVSQPDWSALNPHLLAVAAGIASFFSPCAFPLLPAYLSFSHGVQRQGGDAKPAARRALLLGLAAALGVLTFDLLLGGVIGLLGAGAAKGLSISQADPNRLVLVWRAVLGVILVLLGIGQLRGWSLKPRAADALAYRTRPRQGAAHAHGHGGGGRAALMLYLYGFGYTSAGMGCTGPILAGLMLTAFAAGGFGTAVTAFGVFALTMALLMLLVSGLVATSQRHLIARLQAAAPRIKSASAVLLMAVGLFELLTVARLELFLRWLFP